MSFSLQCFCLAFCLCFAAAAASAAPFTSPHGYRLTVPIGWHIKSPAMSGDDADIVLNQQVAVGRKSTLPLFQIQFRPVDARVTSSNLEVIN